MSCTILIIDDSRSTRESLKEVLESNGQFDNFLLAADGLEGFKLLRENQVELVICDLIMPGVDGFKFLKLKSSDPKFVDIPVILLTGQGATESKVRALEAGASDYLTKPFEAPELIARVRVHLKIKQLQDELRIKNIELEHLVRVDPLTDVANRRHFMEVAEAEFNRWKRYRRPLSLLMIDLDHFKRINDTYGHQAGDQTLVTIADTLKKCIRTNDLVGRYGGEEFALLLLESDIHGAQAVANRCRTRIEEIIIEYDKHSFFITISIGLVSLPNEKISSVKDLIELADRALYTAKRSGRNCWFAA